jgi:hypothetical protein
MILLLLQISFAAKAWRNGWRWRALMPLAIDWGICFLIGMAIGAAGGDSVEGAIPIMLLSEIGALVALVVMALRKPSMALPAATSAPAHSSVAAPEVVTE